MSANAGTDAPRASHVSSRIRKARLATFFGFFQLGAMIIIWSTSTTSLRNHLGWEGAAGDQSFGMLALAIGVGGAIGGFLIGPLIDKLGPRVTTTFTLVVCPLAYIPLALVDGIVGAAIVGAVIGITRGAQDTAVNAHGMQVERFYGRSLMSGFHAAYPAGGFLFGLAGAAFAREFTESPIIAYVSMGGLLAVLGLFFGRWMLGKHELYTTTMVSVADEAELEADRGARSAPLATFFIMVGFGVLLLCTMLSEGAVLDWGQEFVRRHFMTDAGFAALAVSVYSGSQFVGRVFGDRITEAIGARLMIAVSGTVGAAGALVALLGTEPWVALVGFSLIGLGLSAMAPLMLSAAGRRDPRNAGRNIGIVNALGYSGMLIGPAAITVIVNTYGISTMPVLSIILLVLVAIAGPILMRTVGGYRSVEGETPAAGIPVDTVAGAAAEANGSSTTKTTP